MTSEQYIEHEVQLRLHNALFSHIDYKFTNLEKRLDRLESKFNWVIGLMLSGFIIPIILKYLGV
jgi:tetrahydromethanopterin S-methyltransferase subunit G